MHRGQHTENNASTAGSKDQGNSSNLPAMDKKLSRDLETEDRLEYKFIPRLLDTHLA